MAFTLQPGESCPDFRLPGVDGETHSRDDYADAEVLVVAFTCNHCPYVVNSEDRLKSYDATFAPRGVRLVCVNSNEQENHPTDDLDHMVERAEDKGFEFPYLRDESQDAARAFGALRTPHFFLFDRERKLRYTGRMDDSPRDPSKVTTGELADATRAVLDGREVETPLTNPIGCNVKWKGKEKHWMPAEACDLV